MDVAQRAYHRDWKRKYRLTEEGKSKSNIWARNARLRREYGMEPEDYESMLEAQNGVCKICGGSNKSNHRLSVDHCHSTGRIRGLLCHACNAGIGKLRDDPELLRLAADYLEATRR